MATRLTRAKIRELVSASVTAILDVKDSTINETLVEGIVTDACEFVLAEQAKRDQPERQELLSVLEDLTEWVAQAAAEIDARPQILARARELLNKHKEKPA
jgi:hypothetical protein